MKQHGLYRPINRRFLVKKVRTITAYQLSFISVVRYFNQNRLLNVAANCTVNSVVILYCVRKYTIQVHSLSLYYFSFTSLFADISLFFFNTVVLPLPSLYLFAPLTVAISVSCDCHFRYSSVSFPLQNRFPAALLRLLHFPFLYPLHRFQWLASFLRLSFLK